MLLWVKCRVYSLFMGLRLLGWLVNFGFMVNRWVFLGLVFCCLVSICVRLLMFWMFRCLVCFLGMVRV